MTLIGRSIFINRKLTLTLGPEKEQSLDKEMNMWLFF
jgi:hypothetical protein